VAAIDDSCVACGNCGDVADAAVLCPSFYRADVLRNASGWERFKKPHPERRDLLPPAAAREAPHPVLASGRLMFDATQSREKPISIAILAMGGQGGGVLTDWIVAVAEANGWHAQSTSVPGVAQRTGATIYYIEMLPPKGGQAPVLALMPTPGEVDVVIAAELMEAGRSILRGLATPDRTLLITSTHRAYAVAEKEKPGESIADPQAVNAAAGIAARRVIAFDMERAARENGTVVSAPLLGVLAGSAALPFPRESFEQVIAAGGKGTAASLKGFAEGFARASRNELPQLLAKPQPAAAGLPGTLGSARWMSASQGFAPFRLPRMPWPSRASSAPSIFRTSPMAMNISRASKPLPHATSSMAALRVAMPSPPPPRSISPMPWPMMT
jgi:Pyruvate/2-oxoacid:ferredoxin oxidoreductase gamma subunit